MGGFVQTGNYEETRFQAQRKKKSPNANYMDTVDVLDGEVETRTRNFISKGKELHQEIFIEHRLRLEGMEEIPMDIKSTFYEYLSAASVHNRNMEMSFIYAIAHEEKKRLETLKTVIATAALPVEISARPAITALQTGLGLMAYLISVNDKLKLDENLKKYFRVYLFLQDGDLNGIAKEVGCSESKSVCVVCGTRGLETTAHEIMHTMGLYHSFDNDSKYTFKLYNTDNLIDYTHQVYKNRISTNYFQWKKLNSPTPW